MQKTKNDKDKTMSTIIRVAILGWSAALLTASYGGVLQKFDPTFIATVFTACAATFGVNTMKKDGSENDKKEEPRREEFVEAPPEPAPIWNDEVMGYPSRDVSLEDRVEALETKVDDGEGYVQPRTGA